MRVYFRKRTREFERWDIVFMVDFLSTLSEKMLGTLGIIHRVHWGHPYEPRACRNHPLYTLRAVRRSSGRLKVTHSPPEGRGIARTSGLAKAAKPQRLAGCYMVVLRLQPPPSESPQPARSCERRIESRRQAGRMRGCSAGAGWVGMINGWSRASRAAGST